MSGERRLDGLSLKVGPLGEHDRLLTLFSDQEGLIRLAVPGARKPRSRLSGAVPLTMLRLQISGRRGLARVRQLKVIRSFNGVGQQLETLAASQALAELSLMLIAGEDPQPGLLSTLVLHLERLEDLAKQSPQDPLTAMASCIQALVHLLAIGGYGLPVQECCLSGSPLEPPIGLWDWRCSLIKEEGFAIGSHAEATLELNPSELALLQRLVRPNLPRRRDGELMGPRVVWLKLLKIVDCWIQNHLSGRVKALTMLHQTITNLPSERS